MRLASQRAGTLRLSDGPKALEMSMDLPETSYAADIKALVAAGEELGMSFEVYPNKPPTRANGVSTFTDVRLAKINLVDEPAFLGTSVVLNSAQRSRDSQLVKLRARRLASDAVKARHALMVRP
jgi:phage head maturation protease